MTLHFEAGKGDSRRPSSINRAEYEARWNRTFGNKKKNPGGPEITRWSLFSIQACVPETWKSYQIEQWVNRTHPPGTTNGWQVDESLGRTTCESDHHFVHVVLNC